MSRYLISGYYGFGNAGDEAILQSIIDSLRALDGEADLTVLSANPQRTAAEHAVMAIPRTNLWRIAAQMRRSDLFISGGGGLLQDSTSSRSLHYYLGLIRLAQLLRRPTMLYANSLGPIARQSNRKRTGKILQRMHFITVRDQQSWQLAQQLEVPTSSIEITADPVLLLRPPARQPQQKRLVVAVREWPSQHPFLEQVERATAGLVQQGFDVQFLPLHYNRDLAVARQLAKSTGGVCVDNPLRFDQLLSVLSEAELVVAMRLHALIMSAICLRPMVGIAYDPKVSGFLQSIGQPVAGTTEDLLSERLLACVLDSYQRRQLIADELAGRLQEQRRLAGRNAEIAVALARGRQI
jgi:polysaccharide pyruvyl transferase CsaB